MLKTAISFLLVAALAISVGWHASRISRAQRSETTSSPASAGTGTAGATRKTGRCSIVGTVYRAGAPSAAILELRWVSDSTAMGPWGIVTDDDPMHALARAITPRSPIVATSADADGRFEIGGLSVGLYDLVAIARDGARDVDRVRLPADGVIVEEDPVLPDRPVIVRCRVLASDGKPWRGAVLVRDYESRPEDATPEVFEVDAEGRFTLTWPRPGNVLVTAVEEGGRAGFSQEATLPCPGELVLTFGEGLEPAECFVCANDDGKPISGAEVACYSGGAFFSGETGADGKFRFLAKGSAYVGARARGFATGSNGLWGAAAASGLQVRLARGARISGRVTRADTGDPMAGLTVRAIAPSERNSVATTRTDDRGRYLLADLPSDEVTVLAETEDWVTVGLDEAAESGFNPLAVAPRPGETIENDIQMMPGTVLEGMVLDGSGVPVPGALVSAKSTRMEVGMNSHQLVDAPRVKEAATDAAGRFSLRSLTSTLAYQVRASVAGHFPSKSVEVRPSRHPGPLTIALPTIRYIDVSVAEEDTGAPINGADVAAHWGYGWSDDRAPSKPWRTGADGTVRVGPLPAQSTTLTVHADGYVASGRDHVAESESSARVLLERGMALAGRVQLASGEPAEGARVSLDSDGTYLSSTSASDGSFRFRDLGAGRAKLDCRLFRNQVAYQAEAEADAGTEDVILTLRPREKKVEPKAPVRVDVVGPDGRTVARASGALRRPDGSISWLSDRDGVLEVREPQGPGSIEVWGAMDAAGLPLPLGPGSADLTDGQSRVRIVLPRELAISGRVLGADGNGIRGISISAAPAGWMDPPDPGVPFALRSARTTVHTLADGSFRIGGLGGGEYVLEFGTPSRLATIEDMQVRGGAADLVVRASQASVVEISVLDWEEKPVVGAGVRAMTSRRESGVEHGVRHSWTMLEPAAEDTTDSAGLARLVGLVANKTYELEVNPPAARLSGGSARGPMDLRRESVESWLPKNKTVRLHRSFAVRGFVLDQDAQPIADARVYWVSKRESSWGPVWESTRAGRDGAFVIGGLEAGEVELHPDSGSDTAPPFGGAGVKVRAGDEGVVLTTDRGVGLRIRIQNWPHDAEMVEATLISEGKSIFPATQRVRRGGTLNFLGLRDDTAYTLFIPPVGQGLSFLRSHLVPGKEDVRVKLVPGRAISGRLKLPGAAKDATVLARQLMIAEGPSRSADADGRFEILGLPEGMWMLQAEAWVGGERFLGAAQASAGSSVEIDMRAAGK